MSEDRKKTNALALRTAYEIEGLTVGEIAKKFGVSSPYISKLKKAGSWAEPSARPKNVVTEAVTATVTEITSKAMERRASEITAAADRMLNESMDALTEHSQFADAAIRTAKKLLKGVDDALASGKKVSLRGMAETLKLAVEAGDKAGRFGRDARGIRIGEPSATPDAGDNEWSFTHTVHEAKEAV